MTRFTTILMAGVTVFVFTACGGGGGSNTPSTINVDNSALADDKNSYGYYGKKVIFGEDLAVGVWRGTAKTTSGDVTFYISVYDDGFTNQGTLWGVSQDGQRLSESYDIDVVILSALGNGCYKVNFGIADKHGKEAVGEMCKTDDISSVNLNHNLFNTNIK